MGKKSEKTTGTAASRKSAGDVIKTTCKWIYKLRSVFLAIPVVIAAIILAVRNASALPEIVGFDLQATGEFAYTVTRSVAVLGPLAVTAVCLLIMFCCKRVLYPWLISLFTLVLPYVIYFVNNFPG